MTKRILKNLLNKKFFVAIIVIAFLSLAGYSLAKYTKDYKENVLLEANSFYFKSDLLDDNTSQKSYTYKSGIDSITINLYNNDDNLRYSMVQTSYEVAITDINGNSVTNKSGNTINAITGTLARDVLDSASVTFSNLEDGVYVVTARSLAPYTKTLRANFIISNLDNSVNYSINDVAGSPILQMTISTEDYNGNVKITWPSGVTPDNTDSLFRNVNNSYNGGNIIIPFANDSEYIVQFFKEDASLVYTSSNFNVERSNN